MKPLLTRTLGLSILGLFVLAGVAPLVLAEPDGNETARDHREKGQDRRDNASQQQEDRDAHQEKARQHAQDAKGKKLKLNFTLELNGTAVGKDGKNYTIDLSGDLKGDEKSRDGNLSKVEARGTVHVRILNETGAVVKEGDPKVKLKVHLTDEGWKWHLEGIKKWPWDKPKVNLQGNASLDNDTFDLVGAGKVLIKMDGQKKAQPMKAQVEGALVRG